MQDIYEFEQVILKNPDMDAAYMEFPWDCKEEFGSYRVKVHATFDGEKYDGSLCRMGTPNSIIGITKEIRKKINKQPGDIVRVTIKKRD
ncbi:MAG: DUF1905 domain-containing protein [Bacteroidales bacterium]|nr:DUF1905 domain-containing protein [Candidatus Scybalousia scybalohippi]